MVYQLFYKSHLLGTFDDIYNAEAQAKFDYYKKNNKTHEAYEMPVGYFILIQEQKKAA